MEELQFKMQTARLVGEISVLAVLINTQTEWNVLLEYQGSVDELELNIYKKRLYDESNIKFEKYIDGWSAESARDKQHIVASLMRVKNNLKTILKEHGVDYGKLDFWTETIEYRRYILD